MTDDTAFAAMRAAQESAWWAAWSTTAAWVLGLAGLAINAGGLFFIWRQLKANELALESSASSSRAASLAARAAMATSRPWINFTIDRAHIHVNASQPDNIGCQIDYRIENIGQTPALEVVVNFVPYGGDDLGEGIKSLEKAHASSTISSRTLFTGDKIREGRSTNFPWAPEWIASHFGGSFFKVLAEVTYRSSPGGEIHRTPYFVQLQKENPSGPTDYAILPNVSANHPCLVMHLGKDSPSPT